MLPPHPPLSTSSRLAAREEARSKSNLINPLDQILKFSAISTASKASLWCCNYFVHFLKETESCRSRYWNLRHVLFRGLLHLSIGELWPYADEIFDDIVIKLLVIFLINHNFIHPPLGWFFLTISFVHMFICLDQKSWISFRMGYTFLAWH